MLETTIAANLSANWKSSVRRRLEGLYLAAPRFIAAPLYRLARATIFRDIREPHFDLAFRLAREVEGDYLEFGCYRGTSTIMAYRMAQRYRKGGMRFFAFDSFGGLPESEGRVFRAGDMACSSDKFLRSITQAGVDTSRVIVVPGLYSDSLTATLKPQLGLKQAAIVHMDCDLYSSTRQVLAFVEDLLSPGSILIFDDWHSFKAEAAGPECYGEQRAFAEWGLKGAFRPLYDNGVSKVFLMSR